jgi:hypothetical protein
MRNGRSFLAVSLLLLLAVPAGANLCDGIKDKRTTAETGRDVDFYQQLFPNAKYFGNRQWNEIIVECNRKRDTKGNEVSKATAVSGDNADKRTLKSSELRPKVIRGHYNFFGKLITQLKYVYVLSKEKGVWTMVIPYKADINELVEDRVDFKMGSRVVEGDSLGGLIASGHAWELYDASQVKGGKLQTNARPIAETLCATSTFFPGKENKYDGQNELDSHKRDPENKFISLGKIQYRYKRKTEFVVEGCRVDEKRDLFWLDPADGRLVKFKPQDFVLDNFVRVAEEYWSVPGSFELKLLMKGRNEGRFSKETLDLLRDGDHLTVHFATKFLPYQGNQMYKSNIIQFNNFSTMTTDGTYWHEVGHAFGLDDEYGGEKNDGTGKKNDCESPLYAAFSPASYQMCDAGVEGEPKSIYHYVAVSRYITKQSECGEDGDCASGEYCDKGMLTVGKNQCVTIVAIGGTCFNDKGCLSGKCSSIDGTKGTCVCNGDTDCGPGQYCDSGTDLTKNACKPLKNDNEPCDAISGAWHCKSGHCKFGRCYTPQSVPMGGTCFNDDACKAGKCTAVDAFAGTCVCKTDSDCGPGKWCDGGLDAKANACREKLNKGASCGKAGSVGNDHKCKSGQCSGFPDYKCK